MAKLQINLEGNNGNLKKVIKESEGLLKELQSLANSIKINIGGKDTVSNVQAVTNAIRDQRLEMAKAKTSAAESKASEAQYRAELAKVRLELAKLSIEKKKNQQNTQAAAGSYREAQQRLTALGKAIREAAGGFDTSNPKVRAQIEQYRKLNQQLKDFDRLMGNNQRNVGNYPFAGALGEIKSLIASYVSLHGAIMALRFVTSVNKEIDESIVDVGRTTHMTSREIDGLIKSLQGIDTRTSLKGLLDISFIAGKLGVARSEIASFTKAADQLQLALGGEIGDIEHTTEQLGRLIAIFSGDGKITGDALQRMANGIIDLAHAGTASTDFIIDFSKRLAGIKGIAAVSTGSVLGTAAALQELGGSAEVGGTAVTQVLLKMGTNLKKFAQLAGRDLQDFRRTYETNAIEALIQFAEGMSKSADSTEELAKIFSDAEARGVRVISTLGVIGSRADLFREKIGLAGESLQKTDTITKSAALRMHTLGAAFDVARKVFENAFQSRGLTEFATRLVGIDSAMNQLTRSVYENNAAAKQQDKDLDGLLTRYTQLSNNANRSTDENRELKTIIQQITDILPAAATGFDQFGRALDISAERVRNLNSAYRQLIKDQNFAAINKLNKEFIGNTESLTDAQDRLNKALKFQQQTGYNRGIELGRKRIADLTQEQLGLINNIELLGGTLTDAQKKIKAYYTELENPPKSLEQLRKEFDEFSKGLDVKLVLDDENLLNSIKGIQKRISELKALPGSAEEGSPILAEIRELEARLKALRKTKVGVEAEKGSFKALQKELSDLQAKADSTIIGSDTFKRIQELEKRIKVLGETMKNPVSLSKQIAENFKEVVKEIDKIDTGKLIKRGIEIDANIRSFGSNTGVQAQGQGYQSLRGQMLADQDRWKREKELGKQVSDDYYQALQRGVRGFATDFYSAITNISSERYKIESDYNRQIAEAKTAEEKRSLERQKKAALNIETSFSAIFGRLAGSLTQSFEQVFIGSITKGLSKDITEGLKTLDFKVFGKNIGNALVQGAGLAGGVLRGIFSPTSAGGQGLAGGISGAAAGAGLGASLLKGGAFGLAGGPVGAIIGGAVGILGGILGSSAARKREREIQEQQLEQLKEQTRIARQNALAFTSSIIGQQTNQGLVTGVDRDAYGNITWKINGRDLVAVVTKEQNAQMRGL